MLKAKLYLLRDDACPPNEQVGELFIAPAHEFGIEGGGLGFMVDIPKSTLLPGYHGFHVHEHPSLAPSHVKGKLVVGGAAGEHLGYSGPDGHHGPCSLGADGHSGDLHALKVHKGGRVKGCSISPKLTLPMVRGRSVIIHGGADNYSDTPSPNGGGGARIIGGIIP
jgi:Cu-Zn family superoxide dismutase